MFRVFFLLTLSISVLCGFAYLSIGSDLKVHEKLKNEWEANVKTSQQMVDKVERKKNVVFSEAILARMNTNYDIFSKFWKSIGWFGIFFFVLATVFGFMVRFRCPNYTVIWLSFIVLIFGFLPALLYSKIVEYTYEAQEFLFAIPYFGLWAMEFVMIFLAIKPPKHAKGKPYKLAAIIVGALLLFHITWAVIMLSAFKNTTMDPGVFGF